MFRNRTIRTDWLEADRLAALERYRILDTPREEEFEDVVKLAASICGAPISVINLVAGDRQWFKAEVGLGVRETSLDVSICSQAILQPGLFVVPDLTRDERFGCNPLVTGEPRLRFYAGTLLVSADGLPLGTLCILDTEPRPDGLDERQAFALQVLAGQVMAQLELRLILRRQLEAEMRYRAILASAVDYGIISMDLDGTVRTWNEGAAHVLGWSAEEMLGRNCEAFFTPEDRVEGVPAREMEMALAHGCAADERWHLRKDGSRFWASGQMMPLQINEGEVIGFLKILRDRTEQRRDEEQKARLARELQHRVKNTLTMAGAMAKQSFRSAHTIEDAEATLAARLVALDRANDILTRTNWTGAAIADVVEGALAPHRGAVDPFEVSGPPLLLSAKRALSLALAIHELATNAAKYGALSSENGRVALEWQAGTTFTLLWRERNGPPVVPPTRTGFGTRLVERTLAGDFGGTVVIAYHAGGLECLLESPETDLASG